MDLDASAICAAHMQMAQATRMAPIIPFAFITSSWPINRKRSFDPLWLVSALGGQICGLLVGQWKQL